MPYRKLIFGDNEIYHIVNRGVAQAPIFSVDSDYKRFVELLDYYRFSAPISFSHFDRLSKEQKTKLISALKLTQPLAEIHSFCLMPNHFHLLLKQIKENGIKNMLSNLQNSYVKYYNTKLKRVGPLFQSVFKAIRVESDEQLLHCSRYIHLNPSSSFLKKIEDLLSYPWSSLSTYIGNEKLDFIQKDLILGLIKNSTKYREFIFDQAKFQRELNLIKHLLLE